MATKVERLPLSKHLAVALRLGGQSGALLAYALDEPALTDPAIVSHAITSDGFLMVGTTRDLFMNLFSTAEEAREKLEDIAEFAFRKCLIDGDDFDRVMQAANRFQ